MESSTPPTTLLQNTVLCPFCGVPIDAKDYFCPSCGKKVREKPLSTSIGRQLVVYTISILLPPFGLVWVPGYFRMQGVGKKIAIAIVALTLLSFVLFAWFTVDFVNGFEKEMNTMMKSTSDPYSGLGL